jgi:hypothetical protein
LGFPIDWDGLEVPVTTFLAIPFWKLRCQPGVDLVVKIEIEATDTTGFDENTIRTVSENAKTLKFDQAGFETS